MSDEQPVSLKIRKVPGGRVSVRTSGLRKVCIVHYGKIDDDEEIRPLTEQSFRKITHSVCIRQQQNSETTRLDTICSKVPTAFDESVHGCHRWCYVNFTNVSKLEAKCNSGTNSVDDANANVSTAASRKSARTSCSSSASNAVLFPPHLCIFCNKGRKKVRGEYENLVKCVTEKAEQSIKTTAEEVQDFELLGKISGVDLRAREAKYHESCRKSYIRDVNREHHTATVQTELTELGEGTGVNTKLQKEAHLKALQHVCSYMEQSTIEEGNVERMTMLRDKYLSFLSQHSPEYYNEQFRTAKLKDKLISYFGDRIKFWMPHRRYTSELVYAADLDTGAAVQTAYDATASESRILAEAAAILRRNIEVTHANSNDMQWPPSATYLQSEATKAPSSLLDFLALVISGKPQEQSSTKSQTLCKSFAEDICSATTRGKWTVPKHLLLGVTLHHLTGKADVVTMLHRYGHCSSYTTVLEVETAMANQVQQQDTILPSNITATGSKVVHLCWDNFDLNEETPSGAGTTHTTHGIVIQEVQSTEVFLPEPVSIPKSKARSFKPVIPPSQPFIRKSNAEPFIHITSSLESTLDSTLESTLETLPPQAIEVHAISAGHQPDSSPQSAAGCSGGLWILCRTLFNNKLTVPDWTGWLSKTFHGALDMQSRIGYLAPILQPITQYATVKECLTRSMEVSSKVGQEYTLVTMDLAAAKIAYDLIWSDHDLYQKVVLNLGPFHTMCSYMGAVGKMMSGSGFEDIIVEAGLCASGSIEQVMSGRHYNRAVHVHHRMLDAVERMLLNAFRDTLDLTQENDSLAAIVALASEPTPGSFCEAEGNQLCMEFLQRYEDFKDQVRQGSLGKTAQFWLNYCDCVWTLMNFQRAVKENNLDMFIVTIRKMCSLLFSADHLHYARYLPVYYVQLCNLDRTHPGATALLREQGFSVSRSTVPGCRIPVDQTIEQTVNRTAKTTGGIVGFSRNIGAYYRWCLSRHKRATYVEATLDEVDMLDNVVDGHKSTRASSVKRSEVEVSRVLQTFDHFLSPFSTGEDQQGQLFCLSSGQPASDEVAEALCNYAETGDSAAQEFINDRLLTPTVKLKDRMKKLSLKTFQAMAVQCTMNSSKKKTVAVKAERNLLGSLLLLSQHQDISLDLIFQYPLGPIPWSLATADGTPVKTNKSQLMHCVEAMVQETTASEPQTCVNIIDGNALMQAVVSLPETFEGLAMLIFSSLPSSEVVHFVTDTYVPNSVKELERLRRGSAPTYLIGGKKTKLPRDFKSFMRNSDNKRQLTNFLLAEWKTVRYAPKLKGRTVFFVSESDCTKLQSEDGLTVTASAVPELMSNQEEADTRIILHCLHASQHVPTTCGIVVRSPDTDVFVLLLHYSFQIPHQLLFDTGCGNNRRQLDIHKLASELDFAVCAALPSFHAFTGCDSTSAFVRKGKKTPFKLLCKSQPAIGAFTTLGTTANIVDESTYLNIEQFVCSMYGKPSYLDVNKLRCETFRSRYDCNSTQTGIRIHNGIDISLLPPCRTALRKHCQRVNYQAYIWKHCHTAEVNLPSPSGCGWKTDSSGQLVIDWIEDPMPQQLVEVVSEKEGKQISAEQRYEEVEEDEIDNILDIVFDEEVEDDEL